MSSEQEANLEGQLVAFDRARQSIGPAISRGARQLGLYCLVLGVILGLLSGLLHVYRPERSLFAFFALCLISIVSIMALTVVYQKVHSVLPRSFTRNYLIGMFVSFLLYGLGLMTLGYALPWFLVVVLGIVVAAPMICVGLWMVKK